MKPRCHNRPPFKPELSVPDGWSLAGRRVWRVIPDNMEQAYGRLAAAVNKSTTTKGSK